MKKYFSLLLIFAGLLTLCSCNKKQAQQAVESPKCLVLYYSQTGTTRAVAEQLQSLLSADIEAIELVDPYPDDYDATIARSQQERATSSLPALKPLKSDLSQYDVVFLGYPVWYGTYALPIATLLRDNDFAGKTVVPFCTFGSGGLEASARDLQAALPGATVADGYGVRTARLKAVPRELYRFLVEREYIDGEVTPLTGFSEQQPVTDEERAIFDAACSGYRFPLGTPITVGRRGTEEGVDYEFTVSSTLPGSDEQSMATIYVTVGNDSTSTPEFTRVVR